MIRRFFLGSALAGALPVYASTSPQASAARLVPGGDTMVEQHSAFDELAFDAAVGRSARIRQLWENVALKPAVLSNIKNAFNGLEFGYAFPAREILMSVVNHGPSAAYTYGDAIWSKYRISEWLDSQPKSPERNPFYPRKNPVVGSQNPDDPTSVYQDTSIQALQGRGVVFLTCHTAVMEQSKILVDGGYAPSGMTPKDVADDILTHLIPGAIVVPSGVATVAVLQQRFNYAYTTIQ